MKTIKVSEATNVQLDWLVAEVKSIPRLILDGAVHDAELVEFGCEGSTCLNYTTNWSQMGPIIEREKLGWFWNTGNAEWSAANPLGTFCEGGETPLIAAARCYVVSKLGEEVEVPDELA